MKIVILSRNAEKALLKAEAKYKKMIAEAIDDLSMWGDMPKNRDIIKMNGFDSTFRIRVGIYRIIFVCIGNSVTITVLEIKKRKDAYK